jgi:SAM-dependent methyltransferase
VMIHSLSYLRLWQARDLFAECHHLLQGGGRLVIELPDAGKCMQAALDAQGDPDRYLESIRGLYAFDLDDIARRRAYTPYAFGWSFWHLEGELKRAGFKQISFADPVTHGRRLWRDLRCEATK